MSVYISPTLLSVTLSVTIALSWAEASAAPELSLSTDLDTPHFESLPDPAYRGKFSPRPSEISHALLNKENPPSFRREKFRSEDTGPSNFVAVGILSFLGLSTIAYTLYDGNRRSRAIQRTMKDIK